MIKKQQVIFTLTPSGDEKLDISVEFEPALAGTETPEQADMTKMDKHLQNYAGQVASHVMDALKGD